VELPCSHCGFAGTCWHMVRLLITQITSLFVYCANASATYNLLILCAGMTKKSEDCEGAERFHVDYYSHELASVSGKIF
jgi:hypothetical protein